MKIGIDIRLIGKKRTGDEVVFFNLVKNLVKIDNKNSYVLFADLNQLELLGNIEKELGIIKGKNFEIVVLKTKSKFAWNFLVLSWYLRKDPVDVYLTQYITPFFVPKNVKIVTIIHDISFNFFAQFIKFSDLFFLKTLIPLSLKRANKIVGVSQFTKNEIEKYYKINPEKVEWIHNSISEEFLSSDVSIEQRENVREKYRLPEKFVLYLGTLQPRKNVPHLISAFARIKNEIDETKLVICGNRKSHNYDERIDEVIRVNNLEGEVVFPGFIEEADKATIFALAHVFVFPSLYEGFGIPVLEAMSQKVPVICSDIPSLREVAQDSALYFDPLDLDDFSKKLYDISMDNDLRSELIDSGRKRVSFFSWEKSARKMLAIFEKM
ncbi:MAG: Glycosyl transferase group 1 [Candidatus Moranbacteria bacterium GW2011_GWE1_36_7]|nr:MAG: Glycosyl transferase group 1 [Candidatus Moranbacteria bacterium GW2011_GWD2_36_12]KKQ04682.1 MAG: Glycosyl transferase group 1 [Candidatus Moranbacteria bacterium GW2011_GWE2_36_40]KKQ12492.1 MAG: Glycosyl transferase group 1 [Candidatus Moranbacteria bacterium GW2011_GWE1_36_7]